MTHNFIVSDYRKLWIEGATCLYIVEPYVYFQLKKDGHISDYDDVIVAPYQRQSSSDLEKDNKFVQNKFDKYVNILSERLNKIHGTSHSMLFWKRALSLSLERYITFFHDLFESCELYFNIDKHDCNVLSEKSYYIPFDFDEQRNFFQHSNYGQEQIFSIYMHAFYPHALKIKDDQFKTNLQNGSKKSLFLRLLTKDFSRVTVEKIKQKFLEKYYSHKTHKIGILGSLFSPKNFNILMTKSKGLIYPLEWQMGLFDDDIDFISADSRKYLSECQRDFDKFDRFFFASIEYCLPKMFVEYFKKVENYYKNYFEKSKDLTFVISEVWLSVNHLAIALAVLKENGVSHIYNEHNYFEHPWVGTLIYREAELSDIFVSLGWYSDKIPNLVQGGSLYEFNLNKKPKKRHSICYICCGALPKRPNYTASYGMIGDNALKYIDFIRSFFANLTSETRSKILFRGYPRSNSEGWLMYDLEFMLDPYLNQVKKIDDTSTSGKLLMLQSDLVIADYTATSYLEAMIMNIPTIFFWNPDTYYLSDDYSDFFESLISVGICQTDPIKAANFVETIKDNPEKWWRQESVQKAKDDFLLKNMGKPESMIDYLLGLLKADKNLVSSHLKEVV
jgi:putative transferase (TIGR04331 family)